MGTAQLYVCNGMQNVYQTEKTINLVLKFLERLKNTKPQYIYISLQRQYTFVYSIYNWRVNNIETKKLR